MAFMENSCRLAKLYTDPCSSNVALHSSAILSCKSEIFNVKLLCSLNAQSTGVFDTFIHCNAFLPHTVSYIFFVHF